MSPAALLVIGGILTAAMILGIRYLVREDSGVPAAKTQQDSLFKAEDGGKPDAGHEPEYRSGITSGNSLEIFEKTNYNYSAEESSGTPGAARPAAEVKPQKPAASRTAAQKDKGPAKPGAAIPRMREPKDFGTAAPDKQSSPGQVMPDIKSLLKQVQQEQKNGN